ncbi:hypothetical protein [Streptomyces sp. NPDC056660]|uniref:hypothetical protein n=1 Tax=Streptomyces sp. NPDC056660 TaxID=3345897 RepID=UPI0036B0E1EE
MVSLLLVLVLVLVLGASGPFSSGSRFLVPAFPLTHPPRTRALGHVWRARPAQAVLAGGFHAAVSLLCAAYRSSFARSAL